MKNLFNLFRKKQIIPSYHEKRAIIEKVCADHNIESMIETGTFLGDTVEYFRSRLDFVYSIELSEELAAKAQKRFQDVNNVKILQGDSGQLLVDIIQELNKPAVFWLDGHYSSEFFVGDEFIRTAKGEKDTPIEKEIMALIQSPIQHIILIDDARLFTGNGDYPTLSQVKHLVNSKKYKYSVDVESDVIKIIPA